MIMLQHIRACLPDLVIEGTFQWSRNTVSVEDLPVGDQIHKSVVHSRL
jgi:hypothetical protein